MENGVLQVDMRLDGTKVGTRRDFFLVFSLSSLLQVWHNNCFARMMQEHASWSFSSYFEIENGELVPRQLDETTYHLVPSLRSLYIIGSDMQKILIQTQLGHCIIFSLQMMGLDGISHSRYSTQPTTLTRKWMVQLSYMSYGMSWVVTLQPRSNQQKS